MFIPTITRLELKAITTDDEGATAFEFQPSHPVGFAAGQHALWHIPGGGVRPFTIASAPEEALVTLGTVLGSGTRLKRALSALDPGDGLRLVGPLSSFTLEDTGPAVVMLAQGVGVTPFRSMLRHLAATGDATKTTLVQVGATHPFRADTEPLADVAAFPRNRQAFAEALGETVTRDPGATFLIAGARSFNIETEHALRAAGIASSAIRVDHFWGASVPASEPLARRAA